MEQSIIFLKNCMFWLSETSVKICEINKMHKELEKLISSSIFSSTAQGAILVRQKIESVLNNFINAETRIIHSIKNNENYPTKVPLIETRFAVNNEEYLFKIMQSQYKAFIELKFIVYKCLKESSIDYGNGRLHKKLNIKAKEMVSFN